MGSQRVGHDWATELNWTFIIDFKIFYDSEWWNGLLSTYMLFIHGNSNLKFFSLLFLDHLVHLWVFLNFVINLQKIFQHFFNIYWKKSMHKWTLTVWTHVVQGWPIVPFGKPYRTTFSQPREDGEFGAVHSLDQSITQKMTKKTLVQKLTEDNWQKLKVKLVRGDSQSEKAMALH